MAKGVIISGFAGVGKTMLAKKYKNVIDLESGPYKYVYDGISEEQYEALKGSKNRIPNKNYPHNYVEAIKNACKKYDIVCVRYNGDERVDFYDTYGLKYIVCCPTKQAYRGYIKKFKQRGNTKEWIEKKQKIFSGCFGKVQKF